LPDVVLVGQGHEVNTIEWRIAQQAQEVGGGTEPVWSPGQDLHHFSAARPSRQQRDCAIRRSVVASEQRYADVRLPDYATQLFIKPGRTVVGCE
jgi:hypothetical protein